jgi:hypothetical protein
MTTAPGLIHDPLTNSGLPMAATRISAVLTCNNVRLNIVKWRVHAHNFFYILSLAVTLGHRGVSMPQHRHDWISYNVATTENDRRRSCNRYAGGFEKSDDGRRCAGRKERLRCTRRQVANIIRVKSVPKSISTGVLIVTIKYTPIYILLYANSFSHLAFPVCIDMIPKWQLY